jgi:uncharacterized protein DUF4349
VVQVRQLVRRRRTLLIAAGMVLAVLVAALVVGFGSGGGTESDGAGVALGPARPSPMLGQDVTRPRSGEAAKAEPGSPAVDAPAPGVPLGGVQRSLVRTAQLGVEVDDPLGAVRRVRTAAAAAGGFVTEEQSGDTGSWLVLRVPADTLDRLIDEVAAFGRVTGRSSQVADASEEVVDLDARVASQTASVARVRGLLAEAVSIGDVVAIESELARRESELDSLTRRLAALQDQVAMSTLTVDLRAPAAGSPPADRPTPGFLDGLAAGWAGMRVAATAAGAVIGFVLPFVPVLAVLGGLVWLARRIARMRRMAAPAGAGGRSGPGSEGES